jgi:DNA transposition AAA+ family ATPase
MEARLGTGLAQSVPLARHWSARRQPPTSVFAIERPDPLILLDEADRSRMASLEQVRAIFDAGEIGVILIGMPGRENA